MEISEIFPHCENFSSNRFTVQLFGKIFNLTKFLQTNRGGKICKFPHCVTKEDISRVHQISSSATSTLHPFVFKIPLITEIFKELIIKTLWKMKLIFNRRRVVKGFIFQTLNYYLSTTMFWGLVVFWKLQMVSLLIFNTAFLKGGVRQVYADIYR